MYKDPWAWQPERFLPGGEYDQFDDEVRPYMVGGACRGVVSMQGLWRAGGPGVWAVACRAPLRRGEGTMPSLPVFWNAPTHPEPGPQLSPIPRLFPRSSCPSSRGPATAWASILPCWRRASSSPCSSRCRAGPRPAQVAAPAVQGMARPCATPCPAHPAALCCPPPAALRLHHRLPQRRRGELHCHPAGPRERHAHAGAGRAHRGRQVSRRAAQQRPAALRPRSEGHDWQRG